MDAVARPLGPLTAATATTYRTRDCMGPACGSRGGWEASVPIG